MPGAKVAQCAPRQTCGCTPLTFGGAKGRLLRRASYPDFVPSAPRSIPCDFIQSFYVGTCGLVIGGGQMQMPASPYTSPAGQFVVTTGCS